MPSPRLKPKPTPGKVDTGVCGKGWVGTRGFCKRAEVAKRKAEDIGKALNKRRNKDAEKKVKHAGTHLAENVAAWKIGKVVGGAVSAVAASHGHDTESVRLITETVTQAAAMTLMSAADKKKRNPAKMAETFVAEAAAAFVGKTAHAGAENITESMGQSAAVQHFSSLIAGKGGGAITSITAMRSGMAKAVADSVFKTRGDNAADNTNSDSNDDMIKRKLGMSGEQLYQLAMGAYAVAELERKVTTKRRADHGLAMLRSGALAV